MDTGIAVAGLAAFGVIGSSTIQWRINRETLRATGERETALRADAQRQRDEEVARTAAQHAHELAIRAAERDERERAAASEHSRSVQESVDAAEHAASKTGLRALDTFRMHAQRLPASGASPLRKAEWEDRLVSALGEVDAARADILFHASPVAAAFLNARDRCSRILERGREWRHDGTTRAQVEGNWDSIIRELDSLIIDYLVAAERIAPDGAA